MSHKEALSGTNSSTSKAGGSTGGLGNGFMGMKDEVNVPVMKSIT